MDDSSFIIVCGAVVMFVVALGATFNSCGDQRLAECYETYTCPPGEKMTTQRREEWPSGCYCDRPRQPAVKRETP